ncbi:MAG: hypothetical protein IT211_13805 [Armatimonadetes bacterium]|nr:hypothetical protein [Armatimonadota bacterium]
MNTADIITSFFNNELSPEQERQFLLSVAASDSMRLGLKSHVMLDKILADSASDLHISDSVRNTIFAEAESVLANNTAGSGASALGGKGSSGGGAWWQGVRAAFSAKVAAGGVAVALAGFGLGYATHSQLADPSVASSPVQSIVPVPITLRDQSDAVPVPSSTTSPSLASVTDESPSIASERTAARRSHVRSVARHSAAAATPASDAASTSVATPSLTTPAQLPELPALRQGEDLLQSAAAATTDSINNQSSVMNFNGASNPIPSAQVQVKHSKPNRDSNNQKSQGSTTTP